MTFMVQTTANKKVISKNTHAIVCFGSVIPNQWAYHIFTHGSRNNSNLRGLMTYCPMGIVLPAANQRGQKAFSLGGTFSM